MFQVSLAENNVKFDFGSGNVDFWEFAQALKKNIDMNIAEGNHLVYHRNGSFYAKTGSSIDMQKVH